MVGSPLWVSAMPEEPTASTTSCTRMQRRLVHVEREHAGEETPWVCMLVAREHHVFSAIPCESLIDHKVAATVVVMCGFCPVMLAVEYHVLIGAMLPVMEVGVVPWPCCCKWMMAGYEDLALPRSQVVDRPEAAQRARRALDLEEAHRPVERPWPSIRTRRPASGRRCGQRALCLGHERRRRCEEHGPRMSMMRKTATVGRAAEAGDGDSEDANPCERDECVR